MKKRSFLSRFFRFLRRLVVGLILCFLIFSIGLTIFYRYVNPPVTPLMVIRSFDYKDMDKRINKTWVSLDEISPYLYTAAIASEDNLFMRHNGFDKAAIKEAKAYNERMKGQRKRGASTITQQTAKNVFLFPQRSYFRKALEVYFTVLIEFFWSKERIMEVYLNVLETGKGVYGVEAACQLYYKKSAKNISKAEAARLVACFPDPRRRRPDRPTSYLYKRQEQIVSLMGKVETIDLKK